MNIDVLLLDTNLLVLYVVGCASKTYIQKHKKLTEFVEEDYDLLLKIVESANAVLLTPNTLTETSNLIRYIAEPAKTRVIDKYNELVSFVKEQYIESNVAINAPHYLQLGLADAVLLQVADSKKTLVTTDLSLYLAAIKTGKPAINFNHYRDLSLT